MYDMTDDKEADTSTENASPLVPVPPVAEQPLRDLDMTWKTLNAIASTEFVPKPLRGRPTAVLACVKSGEELGIGPMTSLREFDVIDGRPAPSGALLSALVRRAGHRLRPTYLDDQKATCLGERVENGVVVESWSYTFTIEMAERAGLTKKVNWRTYPEAMLYWRAATMVCRLFFPEVVSFAKYTPEELGDEEWIEDVPPIAEIPSQYPPIDPVTGETVAEDTEEESVEPHEGEMMDDEAGAREAERQRRKEKNELLDTIREASDAAVPTAEEALETVAEVLDGEVIEDAESEQWSELLTLISEGAGGKTRVLIEERTRRLCDLCESLELFPEDSIHVLLAHYYEANHWSDLGRKERMIAFSAKVWELAREKVEQADG